MRSSRCSRQVSRSCASRKQYAFHETEKRNSSQRVGRELVARRRAASTVPSSESGASSVVPSRRRGSSVGDDVRDAIDAVEHGVGVEHERRVVVHAMPPHGVVRAVRPVRELAAVAVVEPGDRGCDRHAIFLEQARVVHDHEEPLRNELAVRAAELRHVGVHRELLARDHEVRVGNRRFDDRPAVDRPGGLHEGLVVQERADAGDAFVAAVRVFLAEVARAHRERGGRLGWCS